MSDSYKDKSCSLIWICLLITVCIKEALTAPCDTASNIPVIDICSAKMVKEDNGDHNILLRVTTRQECQCKLSIQYNSPVVIKLRKYQLLSSSAPQDANCGVKLNFTILDSTIWSANCIVKNEYSYPISPSKTIMIRSFKTSGTLPNNEGYCIEISKGSEWNTKEILELQCSNSSDLSKANERYTLADDGKTLHIAIGLTGCGLVVIVLLIVVGIKCKKRRTLNKSDKKSTETRHQDNHTYLPDDLQYNVLYIPAGNEISCNNQQEQSDIKYSAYDDYSCADVNEESFAFKNENSGIQKTTNPKFKNKIEDSANSCSESHVKHISAPGPDGCEYAVVEKTKNRTTKN